MSIAIATSLLLQSLIEWVEPEMRWLQGASRTLVDLLLKLQLPVRFSRDEASAGGRDGIASTSEQASSSSAACSHAYSMACKVIWKGDKSRYRNMCKLDLSATLILILDVTVDPEDWQYLDQHLFAMATITYVTELRRLMSRDVIPFLNSRTRMQHPTQSLLKIPLLCAPTSRCLVSHKLHHFVCTANGKLIKLAIFGCSG